jgi:CDP-glucose 4,6-dehydratase
MDFTGKTIFITGIGGFVGKSTAQFFLEKGAHVVGLVRDYSINYDSNILSKCSLVVGDLKDRDVLRDTLSNYEVDYVLHLASQAIVKICDSDPYSAYETNVMGTVNLLDACRVLKDAPKKILCMVSDKYYATSSVLPYHEDESHPEVGDTYCCSKTCQDFIARSYAKTYGLPVIVIRSCNIYGPGDLNFSRLLPKSIVNLLRGESPILYSHASEFIREFVYVEDVDRAFEVLLEKGIPGEAYNIGDTEKFQILQAITKIKNLINPNVPIKIQQVEFSEISEQYLNADKIKKLGWKPAIDFDEGIKRTISFYSRWLDAPKKRVGLQECV